jgi:dTDP-4-amino-4,6-dideoxygalactose transaminase
MNKIKIFLSPPDVGTAEVQSATRAIESGWVAPLGPELDAFEEDLKFYTGSPHVVGLSSGTAAIHLALNTMKVSRDDVVLVQSFTFSGSANPVAYVGAEPVFVGSEPATWNVCPNALEDAIKSCIASGRRPKALILVHLYGVPALLQEITAICDRYQVPILEDAAESLGSSLTYRQNTGDGQSEKRMTGTIADIGILSFNGNKLITTSGGGALLCKDKKVADHIRFLATQAKDPAPHYQHSQIGYNYRLSNILAAIGRAQLSTVEQKIQIRREHYEYYAANLSSWGGISGLEELPGVRSNRWLSTFIFDQAMYGPVAGVPFRERLRVHLAEQGIESRPLWKPLHMQPVFDSCRYFGSRLEEDLFNTGICLPSGSNMSKVMRAQVMETVEGFLSEKANAA